MEAEILLLYDDEREAEAVAKALSADNRGLPENLVVKTERKNSGVWSYIRCEKSLGTFLATIDDLLRCASTAEQTILSCKTARTMK